MERSLVSIQLNELDWEDRSFVIQSFTSPEALKASVERCGLLFPPWVLAKDDGRHTIVDGFKRLRLLRESGSESAECIAFPRTTDHVSLLLRRIEVKLTGPLLNLAEKAQIISKLSAVLPFQEILAKFFPALDIPPRPETLGKWCRLATGDDALLEGMASEVISERAALELVDWEEEAQREAVSLLKTLRCSASIQMETLERVTEIALGQNKERMTLLNSLELKEILDHPKWNHRQKTQAVRDLLYQWRFPRLRAREARFEQELAEAHLPQTIRLVPPRFFEGEQWQLQLSFRRSEELQNVLEKAETFAHSSELQRIMTPGNPEEKHRSGK